MATYYHAGPRGLTALYPLGELIEDGTITTDEACERWYDKWGDRVEWDQIVGHPTMDEVSLTTDLNEARQIAATIDGAVYEVHVADDEIARINEEGYPTVRRALHITEIE